MSPLKFSQGFVRIHLKHRLRLVVERLICSSSLSPRTEMVDTKTDLVSEYMEVRGAETHVLKYGALPSPQTPGDQQQHLFLIIPGNPGIPEYYEQFMHTLWMESGRKIPVWCVSHAGHVTGPKHSGLAWTDIVKEPGPAYTLQGQINHKVEFIKSMVSPDVGLILIGHSIGCYIILNLLSEIPRHDVLRCFLLFPTIERMALTPNGKVFTPVVNYLRWVLTALVKVLSYLGPRVQRRMLEYHFSGSPVPECGLQASFNLFNPACVNHCTYMAKEEMGAVGELQGSLLKEHLHKLSFYYGAADGWCPKEFCYELRTRFPDADARLCQMDFAHAFVLDAGKEMAHLVWDWVGSHLLSDG